MSNIDYSNTLIHWGVKGMRWGVRKERKESYADQALRKSPGPKVTKVISKTGDKLSIEKERLGPLAVAVAKLTGRKPENNVSSMVIRSEDGKRIGSFQVFPEPEGNGVLRGEWLEIKSSQQGRGYSEAAIRGLILAAEKDSKFKEVRLQVPSDSAPAKHIYSKIGFTKDKDLGVVPGYGNLEDWVYRIK